MAATKLFINGEWVDAKSGETFETYAPSTGEKIADVAKAGREDAQRAVQAAREAFDNGPWPKMSGKERAEKLRKVAELISANAAIPEIEARDGGGTIKKAMFADVPGGASSFTFFADCAENEADVIDRGTAPFPPAQEHRAARADRCVQRHRAVELPVHHGELEDRTRDRGRQLRHVEARELHVAERDRDGEGVRGGRHPARASSTSSPVPAARPVKSSRSTPTSTRSRSPVRPRSAGASCSSRAAP